MKSEKTIAAQLPSAARRRSGRHVESLEGRALFSSWTPISFNFDIHESLQLTDGRVLAQSFGSTSWYLLSPSAAGSYANPTVTPAANALYSHEYYGSAVLRDGRVFVSGGEFGTGENKIEIYNPQTNKWSVVPRPSFYPASDMITDNSVKVLPNGDVLATPGNDGVIGLYNPTTNTWTQAANYPTNWTNELTMAILPDGSVFAPATAYSPFEAYRYVFSLNTWEPAGVPPVSLNTSVGEGGPIATLPDGKLFVLGVDINDKPHSAIYTPPTTATGTGSWTVGPNVPILADKLGADTPMATLPNGNVLFVMHDNTSKSDKWYEYVESTNTLTALTNVPSTLTTGQNRSDILRMLVLPTGQVFITGVGGNKGYLFTPDGAPKSTWLPHINSIAKNSSASYYLSGTQLTGMSEGGVYGDDNSMSTNYPLVELIASNGNIFFARTYHPSTTAVDTGSLVESVDFSLPAKLPKGTYNLRVVASGIASATVTFTV